MKHLCLNLKRFDVPAEMGGVNRIAKGDVWADTIISGVKAELENYRGAARFPMYFPEAHVIGAVAAAGEGSMVEVGCQSVYRGDVAPGVNFGAYTTNRPAAAMKALGVTSTIIGHCEERADKLGVLQEAGVTDTAAVNRLLNKEIKCAIAQGMTVTYCIGEKAEERDNWQAVLAEQLSVGLEGVDTGKVIIAYEPIWAIGPGKTPPGADVIAPIAAFIKEKTNGMPVVYGGGLKKDNAAMLASIKEIDGGLIALTRFTGEIGFYPEEYLEIIRIYMENAK
ncbi:MAG: triose-phosphate isomerase family protein [Clostridia bacterium]|nr:triose-phosphate isomerase family protein [Clostridia bacterium]